MVKVQRPYHMCMQIYMHCQRSHLLCHIFCSVVRAQCEFDSFPLTPDYIATFTACTICTQVLIYAKSLDVLHGTQGVPCIGTFTPTATETLWSLLFEVEKLTER